MPESSEVYAPSPATRQRLLVVDDEPENVELVVRAFRSHFEVHRAHNGEEALTVARRVRPDVIITDQRMPKLSGTEFLTQLKDELPNAIRVLVTGHSDHEALVDAVNEASIHRFIAKPFHTANLRTVVESLLQASRLEVERDALTKNLQQANQELMAHKARLEEMVSARTHELVAANERLKELAVRDGLTDLFNHRYFVEHLEIELARSYRYKRTFCLIFVDVDDFKQINDTHGHATGDEVLCHIADALRPDGHGLRNSDFAARYGGEEFCLVLPETSLAGGLLKAERLREAIANYDWRGAVPALERGLTVSIGVAGYPDHGDSIDGLVVAADKALYEAKRAGKNGVRVASATDPSTESSS